MSAPGRKRLERSPSRSKGQSPTATSRENKIEDPEPSITISVPAASATCGKGEEGSKKPLSTLPKVMYLPKYNECSPTVLLL
eukprot:COSAG06_NODE_322_length_17565_cov_152.607752_24_plen_82_part_00